MRCNCMTIVFLTSVWSETPTIIVDAPRRVIFLSVLIDGGA